MEIMSNNIVDVLRDKTDEADLDQILKSQMGGYTKKSVQDYLAQLKRQQQRSTESFNRDMQTLLEEKESLQAENAQLKNRLTKVVTDYKMLTDQVAAVKAGDTHVTMEDVIQLRGHVRILEKEKQEALSKIKQAEKSAEQKQHIIGDKNRLIDQLKQESIMYQEMLSHARSEKETLQKTVTEQSTQIDQLQGEVHFLKAIVSDGNVSQLNGRIDELTGDVEKLNSELAVRNREAQNYIKQIETLTQQGNVNRTVNDELKGSLDNALMQNEKMEAENTLLHKELERSMKDNLEMMRAQSDLRVQVAVLTRQLDAEKLKNVVNQKDTQTKKK